MLLRAFGCYCLRLDSPKMRESIKSQCWSEAADRCHVHGMSPIKDQAYRQLLLLLFAAHCRFWREITVKFRPPSFSRGLLG